MKKLNATCRSIMPQVDADTAAGVASQTESLGSAVTGAVASNLALTMVFGFAMESLFGMIK